MAESNPFLFSTKYQDDETYLVYYGYRYYGASSGKWLSRDPSGVRGGPGEYAYCNNLPLALFDAHGLWPREAWELWACSECECLYPEVTYEKVPAKPGDPVELFWFRDSSLEERYGFKVHVRWVVRGPPGKCSFYQDELGSWSQLERVGSGLKPATLFGRNWQMPQKYTDEPGIAFGFVPSPLDYGLYEYTLHWDVRFRCVSSKGNSVLRHDTFNLPPQRFNVPGEL